jgi:hypothetical protein
MRTLSLIVLLLLITFNAGCAQRVEQPVKVVYPPLPVLAQVPVPTAYPLSTQQKMQAVHHWEVLAEDVACKVYEVLEHRMLERRFAIFVPSSGTTPFAKSFRELLITRLVEKNIAVASNHDSGMVLSFDIEMIRHGTRLTRTTKGLYKALSPEVFVRRDTTLPGDQQVEDANQAMLRTAEANVDAGVYTHALPRVEVMITTSLMFEGSYVMRDSSTYYINDKEWWHYRQSVVPGEPRVVNYQLVDR